mmetsp:Transcript_13567/g.27737  ORF Transcript_13567/g.27737 Transcript_13567/m.27737 type:complete len:239 (-) Transcript_13567:144-860(-)
MSTPFSRSRVASQLFNLVRSSLPSSSIPTLVTLSSCMCSPSVSRKSSSTSNTLLMSKAPTLSIFCTSTAEWVVSIISANLLMPLILSFSAALSSSSTRSILLRRILSAKATCSTLSFSTPSGFTSSKCWFACLASITVMMASSMYEALTSSSTKKVWATGAGSASPVVSIMMWSNLVSLLASLLSILIKSPRTVQHIHPLFISNISSSVSSTKASSTPTSPNSFSMMAILRLFWFLRI